MTRSHRASIARLVHELAETPGLSRAELAARLGVSERTIQSYLRDLATQGTIVITAHARIARARYYRLAIERIETLRIGWHLASPSAYKTPEEHHATPEQQPQPLRPRAADPA